MEFGLWVEGKQQAVSRHAEGYGQVVPAGVAVGEDEQSDGAGGVSVVEVQCGEVLAREEDGCQVALHVHHALLVQVELTWG